MLPVFCLCTHFALQNYNFFSIYASAREFFSHLAFSVGTDIIRHVVLFFLLFQADLIRRFLFDGSGIWRFSPGASRLSLRHAPPHYPSPQGRQRCRPAREVLNAGVAHAECYLCQLRRMSSGMWFLVLLFRCFPSLFPLFWQVPAVQFHGFVV